MKLNEVQGTVLRSNDVITTAFRIKASRKAFEILSAGLYSDKIQAIIRELSTNAADAHVAAGKSDTPFEVHLPNAFEPYFSVTDSGTGLSANALENIYTTYFESDKTDSNDYTGALGLGSKSPFSYTDSFTVESRFNGMKFVYNAYLSEDGMPSISKLTEESTTESNGLTVQFPVKNGDFREFVEKAERVLPWFKTRPTVKGYRDWVYESRDYLLKNERFGIIRGRNYRNSYVVMGNVAYPIGSYDFLPSSDNSVETQKLRALIDWGVEIYVSIGDVDMAASREKLSYDKRTIAFLKKTVSDALVEMGEEVTKNIATANNLWAARQLLFKVRQSFHSFNFTAMYNGVEIADAVKVEVKVIEVPDELNPGTTKKINRAVAEVEKVTIRSRGDKVSLKKDRVDTIHASDAKIFLHDDRGGIAAVRRYMDTNRSRDEVYIISKYDQEWLNKTGISNVAIKTSSLPKPERAARGSGTGATKAKLYKFVPSGTANNGGSAAAGFWEAADVDVEEVSGVFVEILYFNFRMKAGEETRFPGELKRPLSQLDALGKDVTLYGIRPNDRHLLDDSSEEWLSLKDYAKKVVDEQSPIYLDDLKLAKEFLDVDGETYYRHRLPYEEINSSKLNVDSPFRVFCEKFKRAKVARDNKKVKTFGELLNWSRDNSADSEPSDLLKLRDELLERYPLLKMIDVYRCHDGDGKNYLLDYVNMVDAKDLCQIVAA